LRAGLRPRTPEAGATLPRASPFPHPEDQPVKKLLLLLVVIALGALIAKKVRSA
jgi:hypothetical protein